MTNLSALSRQSGSFITGLLIGMAMVAATFAVTDPASGVWQAVLFYGAPAALMLGLALQVVAADRPRLAPAAPYRGALKAVPGEIWT
jgi:hypothetical protein